MPKRRFHANPLFRQRGRRLELVTERELLALPLKTPTMTLPPALEEDIRAAREVLQGGRWDMHTERAVPRHVLHVERLVRLFLFESLENAQLPRTDRLYVLEFQGPRQYLMFGHTRNLERRLSDHQVAAHRHGYALLNAWASPAVEIAQPIEQVALTVAGDLHGHEHVHECFYDMPFTTGQGVARAVFEMKADVDAGAAANVMA